MKAAWLSPDTWAKLPAKRQGAMAVLKFGAAREFHYFGQYDGSKWSLWNAISWRREDKRWEGERLQISTYGLSSWEMLFFVPPPQRWRRRDVSIWNKERLLAYQSPIALVAEIKEAEQQFWKPSVTLFLPFPNIQVFLRHELSRALDLQSQLLGGSK